jgi:hypothetical protein
MLTQAANLLDEQKATIDALNKVVEAAKALSMSDTWDIAASNDWVLLDKALAELQDNE